MTRMMMEKNIEDDVGACFNKLETLEEDISKMSRMMMEGFKKLETLEEDVGACFKKLEILEENVSKLTRMMMEKSKEEDMGACIEKLDKMGGEQKNQYITPHFYCSVKVPITGNFESVLSRSGKNSEVILQFNYESAIMQSTSMSLQ
ncbi:hypothetical protein Tco_1047260 [Tanacetum coccineum]